MPPWAILLLVTGRCVAMSHTMVSIEALAAGWIAECRPFNANGV